MSTVFLGTSDFAVVVLRRLARSPHRPSLVVTPPDRPRGRGRKVGSPPAALAARELGIDLAQLPSVNEPAAVELVRAADPGVAVVCAFGQLIKPPLLEELQMLNIHPSLLPRWRGAAPIERAIMACDERTGTTVMRLTAGLDSGPVALQEATPIPPGEDFGSLSARLAELSGELIVRALDLYGEGRLELRPQDESLATYAEKIGPEDRRLDPRKGTAEQLAAVVRALTPHIGAYLPLDGGDRLGVRRATPVAAPEGPAAGELTAAGGAILVGCAGGALRLEEVQPPGKRPMTADAFLRGHAPPRLAG